MIDHIPTNPDGQTPLMPIVTPSHIPFAGVRPRPPCSASPEGAAGAPPSPAWLTPAPPPGTWKMHTREPFLEYKRSVTHPPLHINIYLLPFVERPDGKSGVGHPRRTISKTSRRKYCKGYVPGVVSLHMFCCTRIQGDTRFWTRAWFLQDRGAGGGRNRCRYALHHLHTPNSALAPTERWKKQPNLTAILHAHADAHCGGVSITPHGTVETGQLTIHTSFYTHSNHAAEYDGMKSGGDMEHQKTTNESNARHSREHRKKQTFSVSVRPTSTSLRLLAM